MNTAAISVDTDQQGHIGTAISKALTCGDMMVNAGQGLETIFELLGLSGEGYGLPESVDLGLEAAARAIAGLLQETGSALYEAAKLASALDKEGAQ